MKKVILLSFVAILVLAQCSFANTVGVLGKLNTTEEDFPKMFNDEIRSDVLANGANKNDVNYRFYDSLNAMQMALSKGEIDSMLMPDSIADFILASDSSYNLKGVAALRYPHVLAFGFAGNNSFLRQMFNDSLSGMEKDGTLGKLIMTYVNNIGVKNPMKVSFPEFKEGMTVRVAVTGDLPPVDYVAADGTPAGFNTAVLAEISRRLKVNIQVIQVESGARAAALTSGRADCAFWFEGYSKGNELVFDAPEGLIFSNPYYNWHKFFYVGK